MRTWTLVFSIVVHAAAASALLVAPLFATDTLPEPPRITTFIRVVPEVPQPPPPVRRAARALQANPAVPPVEPPTGIAPEMPAPPADDPFVDSGIGIVDGGVPPGVIAGGDILPPPPPAAEPPPMRVGGLISPPQRIHYVAPDYPAIARSARKEGVVILEVLIAEDGSVRSVKILRPEPLLDAAAVAAVQQWRFTPTLLNGQPVPIMMTVTVNFALGRE